MSESELRRALAALDAALGVFKEKQPHQLSVKEVRARLSIAGARRELQECLGEVISAKPRQRGGGA